MHAAQGKLRASALLLRCPHYTPLPTLTYYALRRLEENRSKVRRPGPPRIALDMMSYEEWLARILDAAQGIASRKFQEEAWFPGGKVVSSPDEVYQILMEDCTADLFFETYGTTFSTKQMEFWNELRSRLERYYDNMPRHPDARRVLDDPGWGLVRQAAKRFLRAFDSSGKNQIPLDTSIPTCKLPPDLQSSPTIGADPMASRREFLQIGVAALALPISVRGISPAIEGLAGEPARVPLYKAVFDERFPASRKFAEEAKSLGVATQGMKGDITDFWFNDLYFRWKQGPAAIAGLTAHGPIFCLEDWRGTSACASSFAPTIATARMARSSTPSPARRAC